MLEIPRTYSHLEAENVFHNKFKGRIATSNVIAFLKFIKGSRVQHVLHALKYKNQPAIGRILGKVYGHELANAGYNQFDAIIPVPLHPAKQRRRGYNQSEEFGIGLSESLKIPCLGHGLKRVLITESQTRKTRLNRWMNVHDVFAISFPQEVIGKRILLVDD